MALLEVSALCKYEKEKMVLWDIGFTQAYLQKIAIAGASGSGKSTLLKIIAGLVQPDQGEVKFDNKRVKGPDEKLIPGHREIAYLSQHFELRNNYRVEEMLSLTNTFSTEKSEELYALCRIDHLMKRRTDQLSGGEKQRIALARLLSSSPRLLLLDEPFSNLDPIHKNLLKTVVNDISEKLRITCTLVSHDPGDLLPWADEIFVMQDGRIIQRGAPEHVYHLPVSTYAAELFGVYNYISDTEVQRMLGVGNGANVSRELILRPELLAIDTDKEQTLKGKLNSIYFRGSYYDLEVLFPGQSLIVRSAEIPDAAIGDYLSVSLKNQENSNA